MKSDQDTKGILAAVHEVERFGGVSQGSDPCSVLPSAVTEQARKWPELLSSWAPGSLA